MKNALNFLLLSLLFINLIFTKEIDLVKLSDGQNIVVSTKQIYLEDYPGSFNPSIIKYRDNYLMSFRYCPDVYNEPWISYIGIVVFSESFNQISEPQILLTRPALAKTPSQSEDARLYTYKDRLFVIFNDNVEVVHPSYWDRRDMFIAEVFIENGKFAPSPPLQNYFAIKSTILKSGRKTGCRWKRIINYFSFTL